MEEHGDDDKILSYRDVVLRRSDLDILSSTNFLNDRIIEFYFTHLSSTLKMDDSVLLVPPSITQWIKECRGSIEDFVKPLNFPSKKLILFPVNNNRDVNFAEGGSHWTLLVFSKGANVFINHDSLGGKSSKSLLDAYRLSTALGQYTSTTAELTEFQSAPQQVNGYDCGVYVIAVAKAICEWYKKETEKALEKQAEVMKKQRAEAEAEEESRYQAFHLNGRRRPHMMDRFSSPDEFFRIPPRSGMMAAGRRMGPRGHREGLFSDDFDQNHYDPRRGRRDRSHIPKPVDPCTSSKDDGLWFDALDHITPSAVTLMRSEMLDLINDLIVKNLD